MVPVTTDRGTKVAGVYADRMKYEERAEELQERTVLKRREAEVWALTEQGLDREEIAAELGIAPSTVASHSSRINDRVRRARATIEELGGDRGGGSA